MSRGFINVTIRHNGKIDYYIREEECVAFAVSENLQNDKQSLLRAWREIELLEKLGNKELNIRGRHDAQVCKVYVLTMPNDITHEQCIRRVKNIIDKTNIKDCTWTITVHKGEKNGTTNKHVHLIVNERNLHTMKKDREMNKKSFLDNFRKLYKQEFLEEFRKGKKVFTRNRIKTEKFWQDKTTYMTAIKKYQKIRMEEELNKKMSLQLSIAASTKQQKQQKTKI